MVGENLGLEADLNKMILNAEQMRAKYEERSESGDPMAHSYMLGTAGEQVICFIGGQHSRDPSDPFYDSMVEWHHKFIAQAGNPDVLVLVEGGVVGPVCATIPDAIAQSDENAVTRLLFSEQPGCTVESPEPSTEYEVAKMLEKFTPDEVYAYYVLRQHDQWLRGDRDREPDIDQYLLKVINKYGGECIDATSMRSMIERVTGKPFDQENAEISQRMSDPSTSPISEYCNYLRDEVLLDRIRSAWSSGQSVFVAYGSGHAIKLEPALRQLVDI